GYKYSSGLRYRFPELCRVISIRFKEYNPNVEIFSKALQAALTQTPPPTIQTISKSLNVGRDLLYKSNSEICYQITERYRQFIKETCLIRRKERQEMIRNIVLDIHEKGIYPSLTKVAQLLPVPFNRTPDLPFLIEVRESLGINKKR
ncbi:MAG TPA: hypothetical protein VK400_18935, partial [Pyrinomonadaceae bacterium]|nr:hypothetical protein [Pyrinomonadaceae bacterium]